ncbi:MAG: MerR family transcriptional regulator [bacterium]|nr:MerR family transcriptional regulator [bacterium]
MSAKKEEKKTYYANDVCNMFDVTKKTLFKWESEKKISKVKRDWRQWRLYSDDNLDEIKKVIKEKSTKYKK